MEADRELSRLHRHEMELMLALNRLELATGQQIAGEVIFSHTGRDGVRHGQKAFDEMQRLLAPVDLLCAGSRELRDICDLFGQSRLALAETWREKLATDAQARALWQSLEDELLHLVNLISTRELQRSLEEAESLSEATDYIVWSIFLFTLGLLAFLLSCSCCCGATCCGRWYASPGTFPACATACSRSPSPMSASPNCRKLWTSCLTSAATWAPSGNAAAVWKRRRTPIPA